MKIILSFLISVMAEVVAYFICKWIETSLSALGDPPRSGQAKLDNVTVITSLKNKKPGAATPGFFVSTWTNYNILLG